MDAKIDPIAASVPGFTEHVLQVPLHAWQWQILYSIEDALISGHPKQLAIRCINEAGKTAHIAAPLALAIPMLYPHALVVYTSAVGRQVESQFMPAVTRHKGKEIFKQWEWKTHTIEAPNGGRVEAFTTNEPGRFEGWHNRPPVKLPDGRNYLPPLVMIVDEAKTVSDAIYTAIDRCRPDVLILISSPDHAACQGEFYRAFTKNRALYETWAVGLQDCPHVSKEKIDKLIAKWGENDPFIRASVYGEFPENLDQNQIITTALLDNVMWLQREAQPPQLRKGSERVAWCDFAAGGDENVLALREGNIVEIVAAWRERDTMAAVGEFVRLFRKHGLEPRQIYGDASGLGVGMIDRMREVGYPINRVFNQSPAQYDPEVYANLGAELWGRARRAIENREVIIREDATMIAQMTTRRWKTGSDAEGKRRLQSKEDMRKMGEDSPDRAEAIIGCIAMGQAMTASRQLIKSTPISFAEWNREQSPEREGRSRAMRGMRAGL